MRHFLRGACLLSLLAVTSAPLTATWNLVPCGPESQEAARRFEQAMRKAEPGSPIYVPHPYPKNGQQAVQDFLSYHRTAFSDTSSEQLSPEERRFFTALKNDRLRFEVLRVGNWTPLRCGPERQRDFYFLVRVLDRETGEEITRAAINDDGLPASLIHRPVAPELARFPHPLPKIDTALSKARAVTGLSRLGDAQYVTLWGTVRCTALNPCVAVRVAAKTFVVRGDEVFRIDRSRKDISFQRDLQADRREALIRQHRERGEHLVSLGGDIFVPVVPVQ